MTCPHCSKTFTCSGKLDGITWGWCNKWVDFKEYFEKKKKALKTSELIREKFSWDSCAIPIIERLKAIYATN